MACGLTVGDKLTVLQMVLYAAIALGYGYERNWPKVLYFIGALILTFGVYSMSGVPQHGSN